jgi:tRNA-specific 2-thiouridylase
LIARQGIEVIAINVDIGFGGVHDMTEIFSARARSAGARYLRLDVRQRYLDEVLFTPKHGYGKRFNPCIDCHAFMMRVAREKMEELGAQFIISGEVLGQRPMSQNARSLGLVLDLAADPDNIILRPLSAKLLEPTKPELMGWVDRDKLLDIEGRDRKRQMALAKELGLEDYASPGGGCLLTDVYFTAKLRDFTAHAHLTPDEVELLKVGRHFRLMGGAKLILGRNEAENNALMRLTAEGYEDIDLGEELPGPFGKLSQNASQEERLFAAKSALYYTKCTRGREYPVKIGDQLLQATALDEPEILKSMAVGV